jgi:tRNA pseudouridine55 synthase
VADGILLVAKPTGITSHDAVDEVRRVLGMRKVGHAGTLDPMASGLLLMGVGRATRLLRFLGDMEKEYEGTGHLGTETDTLDALGRVIRTSPVDVSEQALRDAMAALEGESEQRPPAYSAVKVGGRRLYQAARRGEELEAPGRIVMVKRFDLAELSGADFRFRVICSAGTYVRVLVADVGKRLGTGAHLTRLVRTRIGPFRLDDAAPPDRRGTLLPVERSVAHLPRLDLELEEATAAQHGRPLAPAGIEGPYAVFDPDRRLIGVYRDEGARARPEVILSRELKQASPDESLESS